MTGKAVLILLVGMVMILSGYHLKMGNITTRAGENYINYYSKEVAHQIAVSGINIAATKIYRYGKWNISKSYIFQDGALKTIILSDTIGVDTVIVGAVGNYKGKTDSVIAYFGFLSENGTPYTKYVWFANQENGVSWKAGDEIWGPLHTNGTLNHQNDETIIFHDKVTAGKGISSPPKNAKTQFLGGYEVGVYLPEITNMTSLINAATSSGYKFPSSADTMKIEFKSDGKVVVYQNSTALYPEPGTPISTLAPNGAIYSEGPVVVLGGQVNTTATGLTIGSGDNMLFKDEIVYADDPESNPNSDDIIGLVAWNDIIFDNSAKTDWHLQGALMAIKGSLTATDMNKNGTFNYYGSVYQQDRGNAKMFQSYNKLYKHDVRLEDHPPPYYPGPSSSDSKPYLIAWYEQNAKLEF